MVQYPKSIRISTISDTITVIDKSSVSSYIINHPEPKTVRDQFKFALDSQRGLWLDFGYTNHLVKINLYNKLIFYLELPKKNTYQTMLIDASNHVWAMCYDEQSIIGYKVTGHDGQVTHFKEVRYQYTLKQSTEVCIYSGKYATEFSLDNEGKEWNDETFTNLFLDLKAEDNSLNLIQIKTQDSMTYLAGDKFITGYKTHAEYQDITIIENYNRKTGVIQSINLKGSGYSVRLKAFNDITVVSLETGIAFIPKDSVMGSGFVAYRNKPQQVDFMFSDNSWRYTLPDSLVFINVDYSDDSSYELLRFAQNKWEKVYGAKNAALLGYNALDNEAYIVEYSSSGANLVRLKINTGKIERLMKMDYSHPLIQIKNNPSLITLSDMYLITKDRLEKSKIMAWVNFFSKYPLIDTNMQKGIFYWYSVSNIVNIYEKQYFIRTHHVVHSRENGSWFFHNDYTKPNLLVEKDEDQLNVEIPSLIYAAKADSVILKPNWLRCLQDRNGVTFIAHEKKSGENYYLQVSELLNGKLKQKSSDLKIFGASDKLPYIDDYRRISNNLLSIHCADTLFYYLENKWNSVSLKKYLKYGIFINSTMIDNSLYLCFERVLIKHIDENTFYDFSFKDGLPARLWGIHSPNGKDIFLLCDEGIVQFIEPKHMVRVDLQDALAIDKDSIVSLKSNPIIGPSYNRVVFKVSFLGSMYPEESKLHYRLLGQSDTWTTIPYRKDIQYDKLSPGRYSFEVFGIDNHGSISAIYHLDFKIKPFWYQSIWAYLSYILIGCSLLWAIIKWRSYSLITKNRTLELKVEQRTAALHAEQRKIKDSIEYASLIQQSILPQQAQLIEAFKQHFVIWKPRDIVGGDFYWLHTLDSGEIFFAVIDCTGHGVPGALLSMTVNALFDKLIKVMNMHEPGEILTTMHQEIGTTLHQDLDHTQQDGIEIALIRIDKAAKKLCFSGAGLHLLHYSLNGLEHVRGDRYGLGGLKWHQELAFNEVVIPYKEQSRIYLYTDGIIDQPQVDKTKIRRFGHPKWLEFIGTIAEKPLSEQQESCLELLDGMLAFHEQRDDITVIGIGL